MRREEYCESGLGNDISLFGEKEQKLLKIKFNQTNDIEDILDYTDAFKNQDFEHELILPDYNSGKIFRYKFDESLNTIQSRFIYRLHHVYGSINHNHEYKKSRHIDDLALLLCEIFGFDGKQFATRVGNLCLDIGEEVISCNNSREVLKDRKVILVLQETPNSRSKDLSEDMKLACSMIAAAQYYEMRMGNTFTNDYKILGFKIVSDKIIFCSAEVTQNYLEELREGLPIKYGVTINMYTPLSLVSPEGREKIFKLFKCMHEEALHMP